MENKFYMSFWNYVNTGVLNNEEAVADWKKLGMNLPMSFEYNPEKHDKQLMTEQLDLCQKNGMKLIICDSRPHWKTYTEKGEAEYSRLVKEAVADFGSHPAAFGFHIGDEPNKFQMDDMCAAYRITKNSAPHLSPFVNFLPYWEEPNFAEWLGASNYEEYVDYLDSIIKKAGLEMVCYDFYGQMAYFDNPVHTKLYYKNLHLFGEAARRNNIPLWTTLLSVGHWSLKCPSEDDMKWQTSTALAHGCRALFWFFIYERNLDGSFRFPPIDLFWEKTETFNWLSRQNRTVMRYYAEKFDALRLDCVKYINYDYDKSANFIENEFEITKIEFTVAEDTPVIVSRFIDTKDGKTSYLIVNAEKEFPVKIAVYFKDEYAKHNKRPTWMAPGEMTLIELK